MRIARLRMMNWACFRGEHALDLEAKVYAICASRLNDPESSNWSGKSSVLEAVKFAIDGSHRHRTEDDFISRGESRCEVELVFDDGRRAVRSRDRGKRTTLFWYSNDPSLRDGVAMQDEAQKCLDAAVGLGKRDFEATCYFEQRRMARIVLDDPADKMKTFGAWFGLEPLKACEAEASALAAPHEDVILRRGEYARAIEDREKEIQAAIDLACCGKDPKAKLVELEAAVDAARGRLASVEEEFAKNSGRMGARFAVETYDRLVKTGTEVRAELERKNLPLLKTAWETALVGAREASNASAGIVREAIDKRSLVRHGFDGKCPVVGIACPARAVVDGARREATERADAAESAGFEAQRLTRARVAEEQKARAELQEAERLEARLGELREQARRVKAEADAARKDVAAEDPAAFQGRLQVARGDASEAEQALERFKARVEDMKRASEGRAKVLAEVAEAESKVVRFRQAAAIFKAAQRRVAEGALSTIEDEANALLAEAGVKLSVEIRWSREGKGPARACDRCGAPFPASVRVKACAKCGAERGKQVENRLDLALSDRSGAAEDLAGAAIQMAASRWLRAARGTAWGVAMLDEPLAALDATNRKAFATVLNRMLGDIFEQGFVVAHHSSFLDALPGRIEIISDGGWSTVKVVQ